MRRAEKMPQKLHLVRDVLDKLLVDRVQEPIGRADRIALVSESENGPMRVARLEIGAPATARRLSARLGRIVRSIGRRFGFRNGRPVRIAMSKVTSTGIELMLDVSAEHSQALIWERWLQKHVTHWIPCLKRS